MNSRTRAILVTASCSLIGGAAACSSPGSSGPALEQSAAPLVTGAPIVSGLAGKCLDDRGDATDNGNKIQIWRCNGTSAQRWTYRGGTLSGPGGKCLDVKYDAQTRGTPVWLYACNGTPAQQWTVDGTRIRSAAGLCLDVTGDVDADGSAVEIWDCNGGPNQVWKTSAGGAIDAGGTEDSGAPATDSGTGGGGPPPGCAFDGDYDSAGNKYPPGGCFPWYPKSVFFQKLPAQPVVDPSSEMYNAAQGYNSGGAPELIDIGPGQASEPVYYVHGNGTALKVSCGGVPWSESDCAAAGNENGQGQHVDVNGASIDFPPKFTVETVGDAHMSRLDTTQGDEFNAWAATQPTDFASGATFKVAAAGLCDLHGDGTSCGYSTATNMPYSLGLVKAEDILACLDSGDAHCTLPYAVSWAPICNSGRYIYPATWSDGQCQGYPGGPPAAGLRPVEGSRGFLALTDDQVNALDVPDYAKVYLRTIDQEHFGFVDTDTGWSGSAGYASQSQGMWPYDVFGNPNPWTALAQREGIKESNGGYSFPLKTTGVIDTLHQIKWCLPTSSGLCDGKGAAPRSN